MKKKKATMIALDRKEGGNTNRKCGLAHPARPARALLDQNQHPLREQ